ncbi:MAG TPA: hypothetical protein VKU84_12530, partial [Stellaceae bacterium]|nr:hypothetical protein [Stellaceae bacterium]
MADETLTDIIYSMEMELIGIDTIRDALFEILESCCEVDEQGNASDVPFSVATVMTQHLAENFDRLKQKW